MIILQRIIRLVLLYVPVSYLETNKQKISWVFFRIHTDIESSKMNRQIMNRLTK